MELEKAINQLAGVNAGQPGRGWKLFVKVFNPGTAGGTPCVEVTQLITGFDWDNWKILIDTDAPLTKLTPEDVAAIHKSAKDGQSWHAFQSYKKQADRIMLLEAEILTLKSAQGSNL